MIKLIFPPFWSPAQPYLSVPSLAGYLVENGIEIEQMDLSVELYDRLLSEDFLLQCKDRILATHGYSAFTKKADFCYRHVEEYKQGFRSNEALKLEPYINSTAFFSLCFSVISCAYPDEQVNFNGYDCPYDEERSSSLFQCARDAYLGSCNLWLYDQINTLLDFIAKDASLICLSVTGSQQVIPSFLIASMIKRAYPNIKIVLGGGIISRWASKLAQELEFYEYVDFYIVGEGELPLLRLVEYLSDSRDLQEVPGLLFKCSNGSIEMTQATHPLNLKELPTPLFDKRDLVKYFSPNVTLPLLASRGCFWNKCAFCDHSYIYNKSYRQRSIGMLMNDIRQYKNLYGVETINFHDEAIPAKQMEKLARELLSEGISIRWTCCARLDGNLTADTLILAHQSGLSVLFFGFESANGRVLSLMNKGTQMNDLHGILTDSSRAGIWNHLFLLCGFPGETLTEFQETEKFVHAHAEMIHSAAISFFTLTKYSPVAQDPHKYQLLLEESDKDLSLIHLYRNGNDDLKAYYDRLTKQLYYGSYEYSKYIFREHWPLFSSCFHTSLKDEQTPSWIGFLGANNESYFVTNGERKIFQIDKITYEILRWAELGQNDSDGVIKLSHHLGVDTDKLENMIGKVKIAAMKTGLWPATV